jgi:hypothetical protein
MRLTALQFANYAREMLGTPQKDSVECTDSERRMFRATLGVSFETAAALWNKLEPRSKISDRAKPKHLLWTLVFLKVYKLNQSI